MSIFIASLVMILIASSYAILLKRKLAETFFLSVVTIIGILFCFGLLNFAGCLLYGIYVIVGLAIISLIYLFFVWKNNKECLYKAELLQGVLLYSLLLCFSLFINYGQVYHNWDEFSHWGIIIKHFYTFDALGTYNSAGLMAPQYFPGTSLFEYYFSRFTNEFIEYTTYVANNVLYFVLVMPIVKNILKKKEFIVNSLLLIVFILIPLITENFYSLLQVDIILGLYFGFTFIYYFKYKYETSFFGVLMVSGTIFMTTISKDMGLLLSLGAIALLVIDIVVFRSADIKSCFIARKGTLDKVKFVVLLSTPLISVLFVKLSWSMLLSRNKMNGLTGFWHTPSLHSLFLLITKQVAPYQKETARNLVNAVIHTCLTPLPFSMFKFCVFFILTVGVLAIFFKRTFKFTRIMVCALLLAVGAGIYEIVLMIMYVFSFSEYEAVRLASYDRYSFTYVIGMICFVMIFFVSNDSNKNTCLTLSAREFKATFDKIKKKLKSDDSIKYSEIYRLAKMVKTASIILIATFLVVLLYNSSLNGVKRIVYGRTATYQYQFSIRETSVVNKWKKYFDNDNPYVIIQGDNGRLLGPLIFDLQPTYNIANIGYDYTIGLERYPQPTVEDDLYTLIVTPDEWQKYVLDNNFKLLYLFRSDEKFIKVYGKFFPNGVVDDMVYRITVVNGHMQFIPVI